MAKATTYILNTGGHMETRNILLAKALTYAQAEDFCSKLTYSSFHITPQITPRGQDPQNMISDQQMAPPHWPIWEVSVDLCADSAPDSVYFSDSLDGPPDYNTRVGQMIERIERDTEGAGCQWYLAIQALLPDATDVVHYFSTYALSTEQRPLSHDKRQHLISLLQNSLENQDGHLTK